MTKVLLIYDIKNILENINLENIVEEDFECASDPQTKEIKILVES